MLRNESIANPSQSCGHERALTTVSEPETLQPASVSTRQRYSRARGLLPADLFASLDVSTVMTVLWLTGGLLSLAVVCHAYRGYRRNDGRPMFWLAVASVLLFVAPTPLNIGLGVLVSDESMTGAAVSDAISLIGGTPKIGGLLRVLYALYGRDRGVGSPGPDRSQSTPVISKRAPPFVPSTAPTCHPWASIASSTIASPNPVPSAAVE